MTIRLAYLMLARVLSWLALLARSEATKDVGISGIRQVQLRITSPRGTAGTATARPSCAGRGRRSLREGSVVVRGVASRAKSRGRLLAGHAGGLGGVVRHCLGTVRGVRGDGLGGALGLLGHGLGGLVADAHCWANSRWLASTFSAKSKYW